MSFAGAERFDMEEKMPNTKQQNYQPVTFDSIKIGLASPEKIREWSKGEVSAKGFSGLPKTGNAIAVS